MRSTTAIALMALALTMFYVGLRPEGFILGVAVTIVFTIDTYGAPIWRYCTRKKYDK